MRRPRKRVEQGGIHGFDEVSGGSGLYNFGRKHVYSLKNNPLCGVALGQWIRILWRRARHIDFFQYGHRVAFITFMAFVNSMLALIEMLLNGFAISSRLRDEKQWALERPVFVLGHPRSGTTLLQGLLALDSSRFRFCNTFCAGFPNSFLWFESLGKILFRDVIDKKRPMDNMPLHFDLPQEDELATNVLSAGVSPYMPLWFMTREQDFRPFFTFEDAATEDLSTWLDAFKLLLAKLWIREKRSNAVPRRLLLKSPVHTARVKLLLQLFPNAEFVYVHRHPLEVFQSAAHMADTTYWYTYFAEPTKEQIQEFILSQYEILWKAYERDRRELLEPRKKIFEVSFEELSNEPVQTLRELYKHFGWSGFEQFLPKLEQECYGLKGYKRNKFAELPPELVELVRKRWGRSYERLGYT